MSSRSNSSHATQSSSASRSASPCFTDLHRRYGSATASSAPPVAMLLERTRPPPLTTRRRFLPASSEVDLRRLMPMSAPPLPPWDSPTASMDTIDVHRARQRCGSPSLRERVVAGSYHPAGISRTPPPPPISISGPTTPASSLADSGSSMPPGALPSRLRSRTASSPSGWRMPLSPPQSTLSPAPVDPSPATDVVKANTPTPSPDNSSTTPTHLVEHRPRHRRLHHAETPTHGIYPPCRSERHPTISSPCCRLWTAYSTPGDRALPATLDSAHWPWLPPR